MNTSTEFAMSDIKEADLSLQRATAAGDLQGIHDARERLKLSVDRYQVIQGLTTKQVLEERNETLLRAEREHDAHAADLAKHQAALATVEAEMVAAFATIIRTYFEAGKAYGLVNRAHGLLTQSARDAKRTPPQRMADFDVVGRRVKAAVENELERSQVNRGEQFKLSTMLIELGVAHI